MTQTEASEQTSGRPRDARIDEAVLSATRELLLEVGWTGLSLTAVAERAGTTRPALARRWPSLAHLVHEAAFPADLTLPRAPSDTAPDVRDLVAGSLAAFAHPVARAAAPGLVAAITADPTLHRALLLRFSDALGGIEQPLLDLVAGAAFFALLLHPDDLDDRWVDRITALLSHEGITEGTRT
ncbi:TetR/AcrR family transcriptional regulator [Nocardioides marmorisolisilvae]|uniref:TetR/AcrR family transcriptional regulator n=1 Tax=Nocardioides marmorisolisilvae TaxID=1542737 RepID=UPI001C8367F6|nr:helix-turn-helix domain-containing protein [Nocardioides marmorisolisilvae]